MSVSAPRPARTTTFKSGVAAALGALVATTLALGLPAPAQAVPSTGLMITEVYPGGGNASATYNADFIELYNASASPISLAGKSLQYRASTNTGIPSGANLFALPSVSVPAGSYFLVRGGTGTNGVDNPKSYDAISSLAMGGTAGQIYLADSATGIQPVTGAATSVAAGGVIDYSAGKVIDFFGYGTGTTSYETALKSGTITTAGSYKRATPPADNDNNNLDFTISAVSPGPENCDCVAPTLKITEVYTEGGTAGAAYDHDYVEIQNPGGADLPMNGLSLQYRAPGASGAATLVVPLAGVMAGGTFDVVELGSSGGDGASVPGVQYTNNGIDLGIAGGTLMIVKNNAAGFDPGTGAFAGSQYVADLVGWGSSNISETSPVDVGGITAATSFTRAPGAVDTGNNLDDFAVDTPSPNISPVVPIKTIAEIQGTGSATPMANALVQTSGVVTAAYPSGTGNFSGFYVQTPGADTPDASDGMFVFTSTQTLTPAPAVGDAVTIQGRISEFFGMTEMTLGFVGSGSYVNSGPSAQTVVPKTVLPGTDCALPGTGCLTGAALEAAREKSEGELFLPTAPYTVSDSYDGTPWSQAGNRGFQMAGEIGLAANDTQPLIAPTEVHNPTTDPTGLAARVAYNNAHMITLDDGANIDFSSGTNRNIAFPWLTPSHTVRMGAAVTFPKPVVFDYRNDLWKLQPQGKVTDNGESFVSIEQDRPAAPENVLGATGDIKIATFNMLNYFNTTGEQWDNTTARRCSYFTDRGVPPPAQRISVDTCEEDAVDPVTGLDIILPGPRGAANPTNFLRQEAKELEAINTMDADVMSLEEVENSTKIGDADRDDAVIRLVAALNAHWASNHPAYVGDRWAYAPSPRTQAQPTLAEQDAIRSAFIYNPQKVELVGRSRILLNSTAFRNAREPLAQAFKAVGYGSANAFGVIVNHFKSKGDTGGTATGDNVDKGDGAGSYNGDRKRQAAALVAFADQFMADKQIDKMFLTGDYNAYSQEDPVKVITGAGYHDLHPANDEKTYSFGGLAGTLDHVFVNEAAHDMVTGEDVWSINANESVFYEYSRYNSNLTLLYAQNAYRSSDHNPEIVGVDVGEAIPDPDVDTVQVLATNDFHGRLLDNPTGSEAGAASLAGAVKQLRAENPDTVFAAAGDLIGASTFESFVAHDKPTIDALNEAGLEVSAAGNHEFDAGYADLVDRVMAAYDPDDNPEGGAEWQYIAANVRKVADGSAALPETWFTTLSDGRTVGFVGAVTEDLPALVAGEGIAEIEVTDIVDSVNTFADELKGPGGCGETEGCDLVIELVHEGAATTAYSSVTDGSTFAQIVAGANENVDAIVSGHTHLAYNHKVPVQEWIDDGRAVTKRPVVSAGQYGANLNRLEFDFAPGTDDLVGIRQTVLALKDYDADPATQAIVDDAVAAAATVGNQPLGDLEAPFKRALRNDPVTSSVVENRGGESTLGNLVAEIQRWKTGADIAFMNPGGLRADLLGNDGTPRVLTYRQAADVQPFANTLVTMDLTGAQIKAILEQQWQRDADGNVPSRPFLRLGTSDGFSSTYDVSRDEGHRITGMFYDGDPIVLTQTYRVAATSFLASGTGDNFWGFADATNRQDTGKTDLQAVVDYLAEFAEHGVDAPLSVDYGQHQVGVDFPGGAPATYEEGDTVSFGLSSLAMTGEGDVQDAEVEVLLDSTVLGTFAVTNTLQDVPFDEAGAASVSVTLPAVDSGSTTLEVRGTTTGTSVRVPIQTSDGTSDTTTTATADPMVYGTDGSVEVTVSGGPVTGSVQLLDGATVLDEADLAGDGTATLTIAGTALAVGDHTLAVEYSGDASHNPSETTVDVTVSKATSTTEVTVTPGQIVVIEDNATVDVTVSAGGFTPTGDVEVYVDDTLVETQSLAGGEAEVVVGPFSTVGDRTITVTYLGDANAEPSDSDARTLGVVAADSTTTATAEPMVYGTDGAVEVSVTSGSPLTGSARVLDGTTVLDEADLAADGTATLTIAGTALAVGDHTLSVEYSGDAEHGASQTTVEVNVAKASSTTQVMVTPDEVAINQGTANVHATVSATGFTPGGDVEVYVDDTLVETKALAGGEADVTVGPFATLGSRSITVKYLGDEHAEPSESEAADLDVVKADTTVSGEDQQVFDGQPVSIPVTVTPSSATGSVTVKDGDDVVGSATLTDGEATVDIAAGLLGVGGHTLTLEFSGDGTFASSTGQVVVTVLPLGATTTTATAEPMVYGTAGEVEVAVTGGPLTGSVRVLDGTTVLDEADLAADGTASLTIAGTALAVGDHTLTVEYSGDAEHAASQTTVEVSVAKASSSTQASVTPGQVVVGQGTSSVSVTVSAVGFTPTGDVEVYVNNSLVATQALAGGQAQVTIGPFATVGNRTVMVKYLGDANAEPSQSGTSNLDVVKATPTMTVTTTPSRITTKDAIAYRVALSAPGQVVTGTVSISVDGRNLSGTLVNGAVTFDLTKFTKADTYQVTVVYGGSDLANTVTQTVPLVVFKK